MISVLNRLQLLSGNKYFILAVFLLVNLLVTAQTTQEALYQIRASGVYDTTGGEIFLIHTIKKGQTLYMIAKAYDVAVSDIIAENPEVKNGIKADQKIRIPMKPKEEQGRKGGKIVQGEPEAEQKDSLSTSIASVPCGKDSSALRPYYNVALMVPLYLDELDRIDIDTLQEDPFVTYNAFRFVQFYEGFILAVDSMKPSGLPVRIFVYDVGKDTSKTRKLLENPEMKSMNLIIGLLYHRSFLIVSNFAREHNIPLVNPISERVDFLNNNPLVFKIKPSRKNQMKVLTDFLANSCKRGQILIILNGQFRDKECMDTLYQQCMDRDLNVKMVESQDAAINLLYKGSQNYVVAFTDNNVYRLDLSRRLYELRNDYPITLIGLPDWDRIEGLETEYLVQLHTHIMSHSFIDYQDPDIKRFVRSFQNRFSTDPNFLGFLGFDMARFFLTALCNFGISFPQCIDKVDVKTIYSHFSFPPMHQNGFENQYWEILRYDLYQLVRAN
jgi:LysM repeat protein